MFIYGFFFSCSFHPKYFKHGPFILIQFQTRDSCPSKGDDRNIAEYLFNKHAFLSDFVFGTFERMFT